MNVSELKKLQKSYSKYRYQLKEISPFNHQHSTSKHSCESEDGQLEEDGNGNQTERRKEMKKA